MSAPLIFVRDGRTLPFVPITTAALEQLASRIGRRRLAYARSLYMALLEIANEDRADSAAVSRKRLAERAGCSPDLISDLTPELVAAGLVLVQERYHGAERVENEWTIVEPGTSDPRGSEPRPPEAGSHDPHGAQPQPSLEEEEGEDGCSARATDEFPEELPEALRDTAIAVGKLLKRTALTRGQKKEVTRAAVGHAILSFDDRPHLQIAREVEAWLLHGRGAQKRCADIVARYRNFLANSEPAAGPPLPAGVAPLHGRRMSNADAVSSQLRGFAEMERLARASGALPS